MLWRWQRRPHFHLLAALILQISSYSFNLQSASTSKYSAQAVAKLNLQSPSQDLRPSKQNAIAWIATKPTTRFSQRLTSLFQNRFTLFHKRDKLCNKKFSDGLKLQNCICKNSWNHKICLTRLIVLFWIKIAFGYSQIAVLRVKKTQQALLDFFHLKRVDNDLRILDRERATWYGGQ